MNLRAPARLPEAQHALAISDIIVPIIYSSRVREHFPNTSLIIGCGDLPYYYLEFVVSLLDVPLYFVRGNHDKLSENSGHQIRNSPGGGVDLHRRVVNYRGILLAGVEGSLKYREGPFQYSQLEMWQHVLSIAPRLLLNRIVYGRYLDVFVTHSPPDEIHDKDDLPHRGIRAFRWLIETFKPRYHFHGHIHVYHPEAATETMWGATHVINAYGYREKLIEIVR